ncbi:ArsR family transcriptional regulator [Spirillospora sp. NPDC029432]|uniref:ArsR family transcriptional regulator n=1 Tax=Spirillospora sp. NPDC029432 TaxID=3154599 RepID=UPI003456AF59
MGLWRVDADTLAQARFVISPLAEATACLMALRRGTAAHPGERAWLDAHLPAYRARLAADPVAALVIECAVRPRYLADFFTPTPLGEGDPPFEEEVARVRAYPPDEARGHLATALDGPVPDRLRGEDPAGAAAGLLEWVWERAVLPYWERRRRILEADTVARTARLARSGWAEAVDDILPEMRWLGSGRLQVSLRDYPPRDLRGVRLMFVPVTRRRGWVSWEEPDRYAVVYPCSGVLAEPWAPPPRALARLVGPARAGVLVLLATPLSTTQLVALTGQGLGSVGRHLRVLHDAGLVRRRRAGRSVLYSRTAAGDVLVGAVDNPE